MMKSATSSGTDDNVEFVSSTASARAATMAMAGAPRVRISLMACHASVELWISSKWVVYGS